jgi:hypothetical protein
LAVGVDAAFEGRSMVILRYLDLVLVAVAAAPALALGAPALGYLVGAGVWILSRVIAITDRRLLAGRASDDRALLALNLFEPFMRIFLLAGGIVVAGVAGHRADGLTAAVVIFGAYTIAFVVRLASGPPPPRSVS